MSALADLSYTGNILLAASGIGAFFAGKRSGSDRAQGETNEAQRNTIEAQRERIDLLVEQNAGQQKLIDKLAGRVEHLEEMILRGGNSNVVGS